jgi:hypothetical protein
MAGVACDVRLTVGEIRVDVGGDSDHIARHALLRVIVAREIARDVAIRALNAQRGPERTHNRGDLRDVRVRGQDSQIFRRPGGRGASPSAAAPPILSHQMERRKQQ